MRKLDKLFISVLGLGLLAGPAAHAQLGVGTGAAAPRTMLDVNGPIAVAETVQDLTGANPTFTVPATVAQLQLTNGATAPTGTAALSTATAPAPVTGQRLLVFNNTAVPATLNGITVPIGQTTEFVYSASGWRANTGGGSIYTADGTLATARTVTQGSNGLTFTGAGALTKLSGAAATASSIGVGRTATEASLTTVATANSLVAGTAAGDASFFTGNTTASMVLGTPSSSTGTLRLATAGAERLRVTSSGLVSIGNIVPSYTLDVNGTFRTNSTAYLGGYTTLASTVYCASYVGIGTSGPNYPLDVQNSSYYSGGRYGYVNSTGTGSNGSFSAYVSIRTSERIVASEFDAVSDRRLKDVVGLSDSRNDLRLLRQVQITDYHMKDRVQHGNRDFKKVIAQQVESVYPQAVTKMTGFVPTIYHAATLAPTAAGATVLTLPTAHHLQVGDLVRVIGEANEKVETKVLAVPSETSFTIDLPKPETKLFVYGPEVQDLRSVDYEALAMLNLSATQELARQVEALQAANAGLQARLASQASASASTSTLSELQASLQALRAEVQTLRAAGTTASLR